jgi:hypothetical protein
MTEKDKNNEIEPTDQQQGENPAENEGSIPTLVTPIQNLAGQVGTHVMAALNHGDTVAVLTTITGSRTGQQVVSIPLTAEHVQQVHGLIEEIHESDEPERVPCVGFHCHIDTDKDSKD